MKNKILILFIALIGTFPMHAVKPKTLRTQALTATVANIDSIMPKLLAGQIDLATSLDIINASPPTVFEQYKKEIIYAFYGKKIADEIKIALIPYLVALYDNPNNNNALNYVDTYLSGLILNDTVALPIREEIIKNLSQNYLNQKKKDLKTLINNVPTVLACAFIERMPEFQTMNILKAIAERGPITPTIADICARMLNTKTALYYEQKQWYHPAMLAHDNEEQLRKAHITHLKKRIEKDYNGMIYLRHPLQLQQPITDKQQKDTLIKILNQAAPYQDSLDTGPYTESCIYPEQNIIAKYSTENGYGSIFIGTMVEHESENNRETIIKLKLETGVTQIIKCAFSATGELIVHYQKPEFDPAGHETGIISNNIACIQLPLKYLNIENTTFTEIYILDLSYMLHKTIPSTDQDLNILVKAFGTNESQAPYSEEELFTGILSAKKIKELQLQLRHGTLTPNNARSIILNIFGVFSSIDELKKYLQLVLSHPPISSEPLEATTRLVNKTMLEFIDELEQKEAHEV